ncbi:MAG: tRNA intron endonuclease [uncultured archaeon A07HB70]|nr:MAG: tRNA intron endonuclease [uncultured archaeon A07HB70]
MDGRLRDGETGPEVVVGGDARQRFHDAGGYGRPLDGDTLALAPVEAAHLLFRDDLSAVYDGDERLGLRGLLARTGVVRRFVVHRDLRDRGFYCSPARPGWTPDDAAAGCDVVVYPRGKGPGDGVVEHRVRVVGEPDALSVARLVDDPTALAVVDEEGEPTYFDCERGQPGGGTDRTPPDLPTGVAADLNDDRAVVWDPPAALYEAAFYGQRLAGRNAAGGPLQLSLVEAAHLARDGVLALDPTAVVERGRAAAGERFDRRLRSYRAVRTAGSVPKSGFKFGADFRVYDSFDSADETGHSERLVRVVERSTRLSPSDLSLYVRLAGGVRKRMVFAATGPDSVEWLAATRLTP